MRLVQQEMVSRRVGKRDKSPVTVADFAAQAISQRLSRSVSRNGLRRRRKCRRSANRGRPATLEQITHFVRLMEPAATAEQVCRVDRPRGRGADRGSSGRSTRSMARRDFCGGISTRWHWPTFARGVACASALGCPELGSGVWPHRGGPGRVDRRPPRHRWSLLWPAALADASADCGNDPLAVGPNCSLRHRDDRPRCSLLLSKRPTPTPAASANWLKCSASRPIRSRWTARPNTRCLPQAVATSICGCSPRAARLSGKDLGSGGRIDGGRGSGRPGHGPGRQAVGFFPGSHLRNGGLATNGSAACWPPTVGCMASPRRAATTARRDCSAGRSRPQPRAILPDPDLFGYMDQHEPSPIDALQESAKLQGSVWSVRPATAIDSTPGRMIFS